MSNYYTAPTNVMPGYSRNLREERGHIPDWPAGTIFLRNAKQNGGLIGKPFVISYSLRQGGSSEVRHPLLPNPLPRQRHWRTHNELVTDSMKFGLLKAVELRSHSCTAGRCIETDGRHHTYRDNVESRAHAASSL
ncbi:hypothetical protein SAMN05428953_101356 [Mesorhizobium muleiense]|uniref:Uncharacterized protein n=1 Tax=Mesorhizobium muleiense TaxID=1004279 RepID=A0A1G8IEZ6_9HYPH|nr:hypothetical protein SAMN05428953_101356 [Mesorhizobium muleiense]